MAHDTDIDSEEFHKGTEALQALADEVEQERVRKAANRADDLAEKIGVPAHDEDEQGDH